MRQKKTSKRIVLAAFFIICMVILLIFFKKVTQVAAWFDENWFYRTSITITSSGGAVTNYQVPITLDTATLITAGKLQSDCDDIRIVDSSGKSLPYWLDDDANFICNDTDTKIWTKLSTIGATGSTIYIYYGNLSASNLEKPREVFVFFDDFSDSNFTVANWTRTYNPSCTPTYTQTAGYYEINGNGCNGSSLLIMNSLAVSDYTVEAKMQHVGSPGASMGLVSRASTVEAGDFYHQELDETALRLYSFNNWSYSALGNTNTTVAGDTWYTTYLKIAGNALTTYSYTQNVTVTATSATFASGSGGLQVYNQRARFDDFRVRKAATTEPTVGSLASEEKSEAPVAYWKFDEGFGTTANDSSSNSNDGLISGAVWQNEEMCVSGKCLFFDGSNDVVSATSTSTLQPNNITLGVWFKTNNSAEQYFITKNDDNYFFRMSAGKVGFYINTVCASWLETPTTYNDNLWHYATVTYNGSTKIIYIDGQSKASANCSGGNIGTGNTSVYIGNRNSGNFYKGFMDDFKIYAYARSAAQVKSEYNAGKTHTATANGTTASFSGDQSNSGALNDGLVGYWKMDETAGGTAIDSSGNSNSGTYTNGATNAAGKFGNGGSFDGTDDYINAGANASLNLPTDMTFSSWIYPTNLTGSHFIVERRTASGLDLAYSISTNGTKLELFRYDGVGHTQASVADLNINSWNYVAISSGNGVLLFNVNGSIERRTNFASNTSPTGDTYIGRSTAPAPNTREFAGKMDELRIYNRALSLAEIRQLYDFAPSPIAYWNFDEDQGQYTYDKSGNNNTAILGSGATVDSFDPSWVPGKYGGALYFYPDTWVQTSPIGNGSFTASISMWVKRRGSQDPTYLFDARGNTGTGYAYLTGSSVTKSSGTHFVDGIESGTVPADGKWHHVEITSITLNIPQFLKIGHRYGGLGDFPWQGYIDDVKIYNYARSQKQILEDMNGGKPANKSPIAHYKFDEGQGTVANNSGIGGSALNGTLTSMASPATSTSGWTNDGKIGKGLVFDGSNDYIDAGSNAAANPTTEITLIGWIKTSTLSNLSFITKGDIAPPYKGYDVQTTSAGKIRCTASGGASATYGADSISVVNDGIWHHFACSYDGTSNNIYIDGKKETSFTAPNNLGSSNTLTIGKSNWTKFNGSLDEIKIFNYALTEDEVKQEFNQGFQTVLGATKQGDNLLAYDTFTTAGSTSTEALDKVPSLPWSGSGTKASGTMALTPIIGDSVVQNGTLDTDTYWTKGTGVTISDGTANWNNTIGTLATGINTTTANTWYNVGFDMSAYVAGRIAVFLGDRSSSNMTSNGSLNQVIRRGNSGGVTLHPNGWLNTLSVDNIFVKPLTLTSLFSTVNTITADMVAEVNVTATAGFPAGLVLNLDSPTSPSNFILIHHNGTYVDIDESVNGAYITKQRTAVTYVAGATLKAIKSGNTLTVYYNNAIVGSPLTMTTNVNTNHGLFSTYSGNTFDNFSVKSQPIDLTYCVTGSSDYCAAPIAEWKFDEGTGTSAFDKSGNNNTGTLTNGPRWAPGKTGNAIKFDGDNDHIAIADSSLWDFNAGTQKLTVSAWVKFNSFDASSGPVIFRGLTTPNNYAFYLYNNSGNIVMRYYDVTLGSFSSSTITINLNTFHYLTWAIDAGTVSFYQNGVLINSVSGISSVARNPTSMAIGGQDIAGNYTNGVIDDVRIYNYARTPSQIAWDYNKGGPVAWYRFDECQGTTANDASENGNSGTISIGASGTNTSAGTCTGSTGEAWKDGATGKLSSSLEFDGTDDYVTLANESDFDFERTQPFGACAWVYPSNITDIAHEIISKADNNTGIIGWDFLLYDGGSKSDGLTLYIINTWDSNAIQVTVDGIIQANSWQHVCFTYDGSSTASGVRIYKNGVLQSQQNVKNSLTGSILNNVSVMIGKRPNLSSSFMSGQMDDVKVFNYALTSDQVKTEYNGGSIKFSN